MPNNSYLKHSKSNKRLRNRHYYEKLFRASGALGVIFAICMLFILLGSIFIKGYKAFYTYNITTEIVINDNLLNNNENVFEYYNAIKDSFNKIVNTSSNDKILMFTADDIFNLISNNTILNIQQKIKHNKNLENNQTIKVNLAFTSNIEMYLKNYSGIEKLINPRSLTLIKQLEQTGLIKVKFNTTFFTQSDSRNPEQAGINGALLGSIYTILLTLVFSMIIGVGSAVYMEEFAKKNTLSNILEVNINNLAAVPSIVFGLLGLIIFQQFLGVPRSTPLLASFVLTLMALPTIIITTRLSMSSVPKYIKEGAYGLGSSKMQVITQHILPISLPGILTGIIIAISRIIGETAPLLMIGMVAFINSAPSSIEDVALVFPVQILLWFYSPEIGYLEKSSAAILLLLAFLMIINAISIYLRNKFEIKF